MNYGDCTTTWFINRDPDRQCPNCGRKFRVGERVRISSTGIITFVICANGIVCDRRELSQITRQITVVSEDA